jgi:predicted CXXCH cytochrome family protein
MKRPLRWLAAGVLLTLAFAAAGSARLQAAPAPQAATPTPAPESSPVTSDQQCLDCHIAPDQTMELASGEALYLTIDEAAFKASLHAQNNVGCMNCHGDIREYPHPPVQEQSLRQIADSFSGFCGGCHSEEAARQQDSIHQQLREQGNENAAVCSDCHNPHYTQTPGEPRSKIPTTCARCHSGIAQEYRTSVHGAALLSEENPDVPACIDCHGVHNIQDPRTAKFLLYSPNLCASCHTDPQRMGKYGLNTDVLNTYVADFHGTTVALFQRHSPDQVPNKPLCIDCHGIHDIQPTDAANSQVIQQNLLATCQKCHPEATANFPAAWLSHYRPSPEHNPLVYYVNQFYQFFIPGVLGGMAIFVVADAGRRVVRRIQGG